MFFVLLRPIFWEKWKIAPPHSKTAPPQTSEFAKLDEKSVSISVKTFFFFFEITWFWAKKSFEFRISAEKSLSILVKTFFFFPVFWRSPNFGRKKSFEFPSFPRNFVSIFRQTVWNCFYFNEHSSQGRLHTSHSFKTATPPFPNPGYAPGRQVGQAVPSREQLKWRRALAESEGALK